MNEKLLQELINLIKEGKDFAPQAFNELLAQYQGYHFSSGVIGFIFSFICLIMLVLAIRTANRIDWEYPSVPAICSMIFGLFSVIALPISLSVSVESLLKGLYPLASLMGKAL